MDSVPVLPAIAGPLIRQPGGSFWDVPLSVAAPTHKLDQMLLTFIQDCRRMSRVRSLSAILSPSRANIKPLLECYAAADSSTMTAASTAAISSPNGQPFNWALTSAVSGPNVDHPVTALVAAMCNNVGVTGVVERLAAWPLIQAMVAWLAFPTRDTFAAVGSSFRPTPAQLSVPHQPFVDLLLWPGLREAVIHRPDVYATDELLRLYAGSLRLVNWAAGPEEALVADHETGDVWLSDHFTAHARDHRNWRLGRGFVQRYPELRAFVEIDEEQ